jgi:apolipoprotein D and lipocalin family protein
MKKVLVIIILLFLNGCLGMPEAVKPVNEFEISKYLGKWYEIALLDHSFERGLANVTAEYSLNKDGGVTIKNRGFSQADNEWREAEGKAYFVNSDDEGYLRVSFFGPFFGSYVVFGLDKENYQYAFISGPNLSYLWLLSRAPSVDPDLLESFIAMSKKLGFDTEKLILVEQK